MIDCDFTQTVFGRFRCHVCGVELPRLARRNCTGGSPEQNRVRQGRQGILARVTKTCAKCGEFPCLADEDCGHEKALRQWINCPESRWFYV
jgi:hypothetical protein